MRSLLATTALALSAGVAYAEISFSGSATAGIGRTLDANTHDYNDGEFHTYQSGTIDIAASTETSNGLTIGVSTSVTFGDSFAFDDGGFEDNDGTIGAPTVTVAGSGVTLTFSDNGVDHLYSDDTAGDMGIAYSTDTMSVGAVFDVDGLDADGAAQDITWSANGSFTTSGVTVSAAMDADEAYSLGVAYTAGAVSASIGTDTDSADVTINTVTLGYSAEGMSAEISIDDNDDWDVSGSYSANGMGFTVATNEESEWSATASYDLGGASLDAGVTSEDIAYAGVSFSF
jgi:outer membrane protein OmpU